MRHVSKLKFIPQHWGEIIETVRSDSLGALDLVATVLGLGFVETGTLGSMVECPRGLSAAVPVASLQGHQRR